MKLILLSLYTCNVLVIFLFSATECFDPDLTNDSLNYTRDDMQSLFDDNMNWNQGDIPLLNKKVFKGMRVTIREHPYVASIRRNIMHYSVATMLTKNTFITVAHPLAGVPIDELGVVVGENYADRGATLLTVMLVIIHEMFDPYTLLGDLALVRVYEDTPYRCSVKSIQLVHPMSSLNGLGAFVTGWGRCDRTGRELCLPRSSKYTPGEKFDPMLRTVSFKINIPNHYCEGYKRNGVNMYPGMLCVGQAREENKVVSCLAVPGAPLVVNAHLAALQSWGYGCGYDNDLPLVYTSVQYYQPWLVHNIPHLRRITQENLTILFEAKRAYILTKWLNITRIIPPEPFAITDKPMELMLLDRDLAKLKGNIYDIRDYLYDGMYHKHKAKLYYRLRQKLFEKDLIETLKYTVPPPVPFIIFNETTTVSKPTKMFIGEIQTMGSDSELSYEYYE